ncbi:MAG TPA: MBL fold metallo-hydrolase [Symbiobacteriaceae bacterium]
MTNHLAPVEGGAHALAVWDGSWNSYNNCYILATEDGVILIDAGKAEHGEALVQALADLGRKPEEVKLFLATHRHADHIGASDHFHCPKLMHPDDWQRLGPERQAQFAPALTEGEPVEGFDCVLLGQHTEGSVALFHRPTRSLYSGDHVCFFGVPVAPGRLISGGAAERDMARKFVREFAQNTDLRETWNFPAFVAGLVKMQRFDASRAAFCEPTHVSGPGLCPASPLAASGDIQLTRMSWHPHKSGKPTGL